LTTIIAASVLLVPKKDKGKWTLLATTKKGKYFGHIKFKKKA
jgi:hypothetical protein